MGFNYAHEKAKFEAEWKKRAESYHAAGMSEESIQILRDDAWNEFKSDRNYALHTQEYPSEGLNDENDASSLFTKFSSLTDSFTEEDLFERYSWLDAVENPELIHKLKQLDREKLEMVTLVVYEGYTQEEAATLMKIPYRTFKYHWKLLKNFLKNF